MNTNVTPKTINAKTTFKTCELLVRQGADLFLSTYQYPNVNRILSTKVHDEGVVLKLLMIPDDLYKMVTNGPLQFGEGFSTIADVAKSTFVAVNHQGEFAEVALRENDKTVFGRVTFNRTKVGEIYTNVVKELTLGKNYLHVHFNDAISVRNMSNVPETHIGTNKLLYLTDYEYVDGKMVITGSKNLTREEALEYLTEGVRTGQMLIRQFVKDNPIIQVAFNKDNAAIEFTALHNMLRDNNTDCDIIRKNDRFIIDAKAEVQNELLQPQG